MKNNGWVLEYTGGSIYNLIKEFTTKTNKTAVVLITENGASIPQFDNGSFKTLDEFKDDYTELYVDFIDLDVYKDEYIINDSAYEFFTEEQVKEIQEFCYKLDKIVLEED